MSRQTFGTSLDRLGAWISWLPFALPLLYTYPLSGDFGNELGRSVLVEVCGLVALIQIIRHCYWRTLPYRALGLLVVVMLLSLWRAPALGTAVLGRYGDYQGLWLQLAALGVAVLTVQRTAGRTFWRRATLVMLTVCGLSLVVDIGNVLHGYRLAGLLLHDTGMGLYALVSLGLVLLFRPGQGWWWLVPALAVVLSASRLAMVGLFILLGMYAWLLPSLRRRLGLVTLVTVALITFSTLLGQATGRLDNVQRVQDGLGYRATLYSWSFHHIAWAPIGTGSTDIMRVLRPRPHQEVPGALHDTLFVGYPLWYSHCQWLDFAIAYGVLGAGLFLYLLVAAWQRQWRALQTSSGEQRRIVLAGITIGVAMALHLSFNTPSIELWPLVWLALLVPLNGFEPLSAP